MTAIVTEGNVTHLPDPNSDDAVIQHALKILTSRARTPGWYVQGADDLKNYLRVLDYFLLDDELDAYTFHEHGRV